MLVRSIWIKRLASKHNVVSLVFLETSISVSRLLLSHKWVRFVLLVRSIITSLLLLSQSCFKFVCLPTSILDRFFRLRSNETTLITYYVVIFIDSSFFSFYYSINIFDDCPCLIVWLLFFIKEIVDGGCSILICKEVYNLIILLCSFSARWACFGYFWTIFCMLLLAFSCSYLLVTLGIK